MERRDGGEQRAVGIEETVRSACSTWRDDRLWKLSRSRLPRTPARRNSSHANTDLRPTAQAAEDISRSSEARDPHHATSASPTSHSPEAAPKQPRTAPRQLRVPAPARTRPDGDWP